jgi:MmgE/PrpD C-terminal domain
MPQLDRRDFLGTLSLAAVSRPTTPSRSDSPTSGRQDSAPDVRDDVTRALARYVVSGTLIAALRDRLTATIDPAMKEDQVRASLLLKDGPRLEKFVEHAVGSLERPMTDADLEEKCLGLADGVLPLAQTRTLIDPCWKIDGLPNAAQIAEAARIGEHRENAPLDFI